MAAPQVRSLPCAKIMNGCLRTMETCVLPGLHEQKSGHLRRVNLIIYQLKSCRRLRTHCCLSAKPCEPGFARMSRASISVERLLARRKRRRFCSARHRFGCGSGDLTVSVFWLVFHFSMLCFRSYNASMVVVEYLFEPQGGLDVCRGNFDLTTVRRGGGGCGDRDGQGCVRMRQRDIAGTKHFVGREDCFECAFTRKRDRHAVRLQGLWRHVVASCHKLC